MLRHVFIIITIIEKVPLPLYDSGGGWAEFGDVESVAEVSPERKRTLYPFVL